MTQVKASSEIVALANQLLQQRSLGSLTAIEPLSGGRNNRTYRVTGDRGAWLVKHYFQDTSVGRDRCVSEWNWSSFCWQQGMTCIPEPLATDFLHKISLFEFIDGRPLHVEEITARHVTQAAEYVQEVNRHRDRPSAQILSDAAEACFSLQEHIDCVEKRVQRLIALPLVDGTDNDLQAWLASSLLPTWRSLADQLMTNHLNELPVRLSLSNRCLSPSDFGFHNALERNDGRLCFFDFEYAGWDDPAKLICDFFWQQQLPAPREAQEVLIDALANAESVSSLKQRVEILFPVYGIKWCCLVLNEFVSEDRRRREFAQTTTIDNHHRAGQLIRAQALLQSIRSQIP